VDAAEDNAPRSTVRPAEAETRVVKTRHPPASFRIEGPRALRCPPPRFTARGRRAMNAARTSTKAMTLRDEQTDTRRRWRREHAM